VADILFDLDGTLTDSWPGITRCIAHALRGMGAAAPAEDALRGCVGPPLAETFARLLDAPDETDIAEALRLYRERFVATGMFENAVFPGVREGLDRLRRGGHRLWVATSKPRVYARRIVEHFELVPFFAGVYGPELDLTNHDKRDLLRVLLAAEGLDPRRTVMVGDRMHDVEGARANGVSAVGVAWGYGSAEELRAAGPDAIVRDMEELCAWVQARVGGEGSDVASRDV
jgi:phosphoglycolate phosphatase